MEGGGLRRELTKALPGLGVGNKEAAIIKDEIDGLR
jgi:hypothetical protein